MRLGTFITLLSETYGLHESSVAAVARVMREAGWLTTGARGVNAPEMTHIDAARLTLALLSGEPPGKVVEEFEFLRGLEATTPPLATGFTAGSGLDQAHCLEDALIWIFAFVRDEPDFHWDDPITLETWIKEEVPHLRIIDDALWQRVKQRQGVIRADVLGAREETPNAPQDRARTTRPLPSVGWLQCGRSGSGYVMISDSRYGCAAARNSGTWANRKTIKRTVVEDRVLAGLKQRLMHPDLIAELIAEYQRERQRERIVQQTERAAAERRLVKAEKEIEAIIKAITDGLYHPSMKAKMDILETERAAAQAAMCATPLPDEIPLHTRLAAVYARKVTDLAASLNHDGTRREAVALLRGLIESVILIPDEAAPNGHAIELCGELGAILTLCG